jgi:hypothetical protein
MDVIIYISSIISMHLHNPILHYRLQGLGPKTDMRWEIYIRHAPNHFKLLACIESHNFKLILVHIN